MTEQYLLETAKVQSRRYWDRVYETPVGTIENKKAFNRALSFDKSLQRTILQQELNLVNAITQKIIKKSGIKLGL